MANIASTTLVIKDDPAKLDEIAATLATVIAEAEPGDYDKFYLKFSKLDATGMPMGEPPDFDELYAASQAEAAGLPPPEPKKKTYWDRQPYWLGMRTKPEIKEGTLTLSGDSKYVMPYHFCEWLAKQYGVKVEFWSCEEHELMFDGWYTPDGVCHVQNQYTSYIRDPIKSYAVKDGVICCETQLEDDPVALEEFKKRRRAEYDALVPADLPEIDPKWYQGDVADVIVQARLYGAYKEWRSSQELPWPVDHAHLEYYLLGKKDDSIVTVRVWCNDGREAILVRTYGDDALLDADPPLTRDEHWIPRPVRTLLQDWLAKGFFGDGPAKLRPHYNFGPPLVTA